MKVAAAVRNEQKHLPGENRSESLLTRAELLLAAAEAVQLKGSECKDTALQEALGRMLTSSALLRNEVMSDSSAMLEQARRERDRIAAEIEVLRAERDLCLALAVEAGSAAGRHLAERYDLLRGGLSPRADSPPEHAAAISLDNLIEAKVGPDATNAVDRVVLTVAGIGGLLELSKIEDVLDTLHNVQHIVVRTLKDGLATIDLTLFPPTPTLLVAVDLLSLESELGVTAVTLGTIDARLQKRVDLDRRFGQHLQDSPG